MPKTKPKDIGKECDWCHQGIGIFTYECKEVLEGEYCTSDHYTEAMMKKLAEGGEE